MSTELPDLTEERPQERVSKGGNAHCLLPILRDARCAPPQDEVVRRALP